MGEQHWVKEMREFHHVVALNVTETFKLNFYETGVNRDKVVRDYKDDMEEETHSMVEKRLVKGHSTQFFQHYCDTKHFSV